MIHHYACPCGARDERGTVDAAGSCWSCRRPDTMGRWGVSTAVGALIRKEVSGKRQLLSERRAA